MQKWGKGDYLNARYNIHLFIIQVKEVEPEKALDTYVATNTSSPAKVDVAHEVLPSPAQQQEQQQHQQPAPQEQRQRRRRVKEEKVINSLL